jgi:hypothetical protein
VREFVAVNDFLTISRQQLLKQEALIFHRIAIPFLKDFLSEMNKFNASPEFIGNLEWLISKDIVFAPEISRNANIATNEYKHRSDLSFNYAKDVASTIIGFNFDDLEEVRRDEIKRTIIKRKVDGLPLLTLDEIKRMFESDRFGESVVLMSDSFTRMASIQLRALSGIDAYPVLLIDDLTTKEASLNKDDVIKIVLNTFPVPDESISWEQILEYRSDPDSQSKFLALRNWMNEIARSERTPAEVEEKLEYLIDQYQKHMRLHRMKTNTGTLETIITTSAEVLGDLISFKWGKAAQALFSLKHRQIALMEGELTSPGNEVAYIVNAREKFS